MAASATAEQVALLTQAIATCEGGPNISRRLGDRHLSTSSKAVVNKFLNEWPAAGSALPSDLQKKSFRALDLMSDLHDLFEAAKPIYRKLLPRVIVFRLQRGAHAEHFELVDIDGSQGRPIYQNRRLLDTNKSFLAWSKQKQGGVWAVHTNKEGSDCGDYYLSSPLPVDPGVWHESTGDQPAPEVTCGPAPETDPVVNALLARDLAECWNSNAVTMSQATSAPRPTNRDLCFNLAAILSKYPIGDAKLDDGRTLLEASKALFSAMCSIAEKIDPMTQRYRPKAPTWTEIFRSLDSLASLATGGIWKEMSKELPGPPGECELTWVQCMIYMCRALDVSDLRLSSASWLLRLCNRVFLRGFQDARPKHWYFVDMRETHDAKVVDKLKAKSPSCLRCAIISDTHGWDADLDLPPADVLLHSGDVLFEGCSLGPNKEVPPDLESTLKTFSEDRFRRYRWIFLVGGNHDRSLHDLWALYPDTLRQHLPPNLVLLQAPAALNPPIEKTCLSKDKGVEAVAKDGAVKILSNFELSEPDDPRPGWVVAGTGISLANSPWTANNAFQLIKDKDDTHKEDRVSAAKSLVRHNPDIVLSHGPPEDEKHKKGDEHLAKAVNECSSVRAHIFGHVHETYGAEVSKDKSRCSINAAMSSPLYVPAVEPIVMDLPLRRRPEWGQQRHVVLDEVDVDGVTPWEVCLHFKGYLVAAVAIVPRRIFVYFDKAYYADFALSTLQHEPFKTSRGEQTVVLRSRKETDQLPLKTEWTCLFDIIGGGRDTLTWEMLETARQARILPREPVA